jgi:diguanylate cyclase (GGDEF)-like protein
MSSQQSKILIIDDDERYIQSLSSLLESQYAIVTTAESENALNIAMVEQPHLVLLDLMMEGIDGYQVIRELKQNLETADIPIIIVTGSHDFRDETLCLKLGAVDYITKPYNPEIVKARVHTHVEMKRQKDFLKTLSYQDGLTGIANRRYFDDALIREHRRCKRNGTPLSLLMIDIDFFKAYNDIYGHLTGDDCLKLVVLTMQEQLSRSSDLLARYGGEEFICVLPDTDLEGAKVIAERMRSAILEQQIPHKKGVGGMITVSLGVVSGMPREGVDPRKFLISADQCLYRAKVSGRNRICVETCCESEVAQMSS